MPAFSNATQLARVAVRPVLVAALLVALTGCSEYLARRDGITLNAGNAVMTNQVTQMVDPWPRNAGNRNIAFNGERMDAAYQRYRTGHVTPPRGISTGTTYQAPTAPPAANLTPVGPTVTPAPVK
jgi:hypothetical protein